MATALVALWLWQKSTLVGHVFLDISRTLLEQHLVTGWVASRARGGALALIMGCGLW